VRAGDTLTASAIEVSRSRKLGVYRIDVTRQDGALVSTFTGTVYVTERPNEAGA
jgi:acyl-coenzyme A thioesterase PaaI-like protein